LGSPEPVRVLVVDDDPAVRRLLAAALASLSSAPALIREATSIAGGIAAAQESVLHAAVVCLDLRGATDGIAALRRAGIRGPILATSRQGSVSVAVDAMRNGADDFVVKPFHPADLARRLALALEASGARDSAGGSLPIDAMFPADGFEGFIGASEPMLALYDQIVRVAPSKAPVFITGESGTGKEVCAQALHVRSNCAKGPFIALNCGAIPRELMESEIFGHVKGAYTGAHDDRAGAAELAHGGTLFLDEICEMDIGLQAKLLRFIQTGTVRRVGDTKERAVDVRFVCATNRNPKAAVAEGRFREDLFYRLHVLPLNLPPLRERAGDVALLAQAFLARFAEEEGRAFCGFDAEAARLLETYPWPGNVRELQNVIRRVVVLHDGAEVRAEMLMLPLVPANDDPLPLIGSPSIDPFWRQEQKIIERALAAHGGNAARAAAALEISPSTIYRKLQAWSQGRAAV
jgi:two-component system repressor protein LuxO